MKHVDWRIGGAVAAVLLLWSAAAAKATDFWQGILRSVAGDTIADTRVVNAISRTVTGFTEEEELAIGREAAGRVLGAAPLVADSVLQRRVNLVGRWIALQGERPDLPWRFGVIESEDINAFAAPGGAVLVTRGLYRLLKDECELAGVLAHEIAHVIRKHHLKLMQKGALIEAGSGFFASRVTGDSSVQRWLGTGAELFARSLDRSAEYEADRMALILAARAGYDLFGLPAVLQEIGHSAAGDSRVELLFSTHPLPDDRLMQLDQAVGDRLDRVGGKSGKRINK